VQGEERRALRGTALETDDQLEAVPEGQAGQSRARDQCGDPCQALGQQREEQRAAGSVRRPAGKRHLINQGAPYSKYALLKASRP
jgi:hypothetical protein